MVDTIDEVVGGMYSALVVWQSNKKAGSSVGNIIVALIFDNRQVKLRIRGRK